MYLFNIFLLIFFILFSNIEAREISTVEEDFLNNELLPHLDKNKFLKAQHINGYYRGNLRDSLNNFSDIINYFYKVEYLPYDKGNFSLKSSHCSNKSIFLPNTIKCIVVNLPFINSQVNKDIKVSYKFTYPVYGEDAHMVDFDYNSTEPLTKTDILLNNYTYNIVSFYKQIISKDNRHQKMIDNEISYRVSSERIYSTLSNFERTLSVAGTNLNTEDNILYVISIVGKAKDSEENARISMIFNKIKDNGDFNKDLYILINMSTDGY